MDIRYTVGIVLIAVGGLLALLGGIALVAPGPPDARPGLGFRLGCGGFGAVGVLMVLGGLRLRNRAVADSPALRRAIEERGGPTSRTGTAKPRFLTRAPTAGPTEAERPKAEPVPPPAPPRSGTFVYWLVFLAFALVVIGLAVATLDFFRGPDNGLAIVLVVTILVILAMPVWALGRRRRS